MDHESQGLRTRISEVRLLPVAITALLLITVMLGLVFMGNSTGSRAFFQASTTTAAGPLSESDLEDVPGELPSPISTTPPLENVGFRPNVSAELIEDEYDLDFVRCEECPLGHFGSSKQIGPKSPTYIGYHQGTEVRVRATFNDDFSIIRELVVVPPSNDITRDDLELTESDD